MDVLLYDKKKNISILAPTVNIIGGGQRGRIEISYDGQKGSICNKYWSKTNARVLCKEKGFADGETTNLGSVGTGKVFLSNVLCTGTESSILMCNSTGWDVSSDECANHRKDVEVMCYTDGMHNKVTSLNLEITIFMYMVLYTCPSSANLDRLMNPRDSFQLITISTFS